MGERLAILTGHWDSVRCVAWSPDGRTLVSSSKDLTLRLWNARTGEALMTLADHPALNHLILCIAWSPDSRWLATGSEDGGVSLWETRTGELVDKLERHTGAVYSVSWSPDGRTLASGGDDRRILLRSLSSSVQILQGHSDTVRSVTPDGKTLASSSSDASIRIWDPLTLGQVRVLQRHTQNVFSVVFSSDARLLASKSRDGTVQIWRTADWQLLWVIEEPSSDEWPRGLAFHPRAPILATRTEDGAGVRIWELEPELLFQARPAVSWAHYAVARVVLVGESGAGKTCLARALMNEPFKPQEATHGMRISTFHAETVVGTDGSVLTREILLWDLAGQTDYQVVNQLFLDQTALGLVVFDPTDDDPLHGVLGWENSLRRLTDGRCSTILVAGRIDRGHLAATPPQVQAFCSDHGFSSFFETSAKTGDGIAAVRSAIAASVKWETLPTTSTPKLWSSMREFLLERRKHAEHRAQSSESLPKHRASSSDKHVLSTRKNLRKAFQRKHKGVRFSPAEFETVLDQLQAHGLVWQLSFEDYLLLRPEILNAYASVVVLEARRHEQGLGSIAESRVLNGNLGFGDMERLAEPWQERLLLHTVVELFLRRELAYRVGQELVFPSKFSLKRPRAPEPPPHEVAYSFAGPVEAIYAKLIVRLFYSGAFDQPTLWKDAAEFNDSLGKVHGVLLRTAETGRGLLDVFFDEVASLDSKALFLRFVHEHLQREALPGSLKRERIYYCPNTRCRKEVRDRVAVEERIAKGLTSIRCLYCDGSIELIDVLERRFGDPEVQRQAEAIQDEGARRRDQEVGVANTIDVFLSYNRLEVELVAELAQELRQRGLRPWFDRDDIVGGDPFPRTIEDAISRAKTAAFIVGTSGVGKRWHERERQALIQRSVEKGLRVIPVLLPGVDKIPDGFEPVQCVRFARSVRETTTLDSLERAIASQSSAIDSSGPDPA